MAIDIGSAAANTRQFTAFIPFRTSGQPDYQSDAAKLWWQLRTLEIHTADPSALPLVIASHRQDVALAQRIAAAYPGLKTDVVEEDEILPRLSRSDIPPHLRPKALRLAFAAGTTSRYVAFLNPSCFFVEHFHPNEDFLFEGKLVTRLSYPTTIGGWPTEAMHVLGVPLPDTPRWMIGTPQLVDATILRAAVERVCERLDGSLLTVVTRNSHLTWDPYALYFVFAHAMGLWSNNHIDLSQQSDRRPLRRPDSALPDGEPSEEALRQLFSGEGRGICAHIRGASLSPIEKWLGETIGNPRSRPFLARVRRENAEGGVIGTRHPFPYGGKFGELRNAKEKLLALLEFEYGRPVAHATGELLSKLEHGDPDQRIAKLSARVQGSALAAFGAGSEAPEVSIVIPVHNALHHTLACIASIFSFPPTRSFEIIIGDDGSTDGTAETLKSIAPAVRLVGRDVPVGFLENCNTAAQSAVGKFLVLLNNDTLVLPGSIDALIDTLETCRRAGLVGSRLIYPNGTLQEAGGIVFSDGSAANNGNRDDPLAPPYNFLRRVDYCSAASVALPMALWQRLGGFDSRYAPAYYEDTDLAMRIREAGYDVFYQPRATVVHFEGASHGIELRVGVKRFQVRNRTLFFERWNRTLAGFRSPALPRLQRRDGQRILVIDAETPRADRDSGSLDTLTYLEVLAEAGFDIVFAAEKLAYVPGYTSRLQGIGVQVLFRPYWESFADIFERFGPSLFAVLVFRAPVAASVFPLAREYAPQARLVFNTVDLHFLRAERKAALAAGEAPEKSFARDEELALIRTADSTIVVSEFERQLLSELAPEACVKTIPIARESPDVAPRSFAERRDILFIGGFRHTPNVDAILWFVHQVWPILRVRGFVDNLLLVGSDMPEEVRALGRRAGIIAYGYVPDLRHLFQCCRLSIAPLRYGAGVKGKVVTSLSFRVPVVASSIAVEGMGIESGREALVADGADETATAILRIYNDAALWDYVSRAGFDLFERRFSRSGVAGLIVDVIRGR